MNSHAIRKYAFLLALVPWSLPAQDQNVVITGIFRPLSGLSAGATSQAVLTEADAQLVIQNALQIAAPNPNIYYLVHAVRYQSGTKSGSVAAQNWYVYYQPWINAGRLEHIIDPRVARHFAETRLYGSASVAMVYVHIVDGVTRAVAEASAPATDRTSFLNQVAFLYGDINATDQQFQIVDQSAAPLRVFSNILIEKGQADVLEKVAYEISISKVVPEPEQNLQAIVGLALGANAGGAAPKTTHTSSIAFAAGGAPFHVLHLPSKMEVSARSEQDDKELELGKNTYQNEKKYWYDFSLALPLKSYNEFRYDQANNQITAEEINKKNVWAFLNLGIPRDTSHMEAQYIPTILYGMPITSQPLHHHIFAGAVGLNLVNVFFGVRLDRKPFYLDFSKPLNGTNVEQRWRTHFTYGINFPVGTIVKALSKKTASN